MREDPIVFEDWKVGRPGFTDPKRVVQINFLLTFLIAASQITQGIVFRSAMLVFSWVFFLMIAIIVELIFDQFERGLLNQFGFVSLLILVSIFSTPINSVLVSNLAFRILQIVVGLLMLGKVVIVYLLYLELKFNQKVLVPRSELASSMLAEQIMRIKHTEYEITSNFNVLFKLIMEGFRKQFVLVSILIVLFAIIPTLIGSTLIITYAFSIIISIISSVFILTILYAWWDVKRKQKRKIIENVVEPEPLFAEILSHT